MLCLLLLHGPTISLRTGSIRGIPRLAVIFTTVAYLEHAQWPLVAAGSRALPVDSGSGNSGLLCLYIAKRNGAVLPIAHNN